jgi:hypothetical protein
MSSFIAQANGPLVLIGQGVFCFNTKPIVIPKRSEDLLLPRAMNLQILDSRRLSAPEMTPSVEAARFV